MVLRKATRFLTAVVLAATGAVVAVMVGATAALASEPMPEPVGRSGIWPPLPPPAVAVPVLGDDGVGDWVFAGVLVLAATVTLAIPGHGRPRHP